MTRKDATPTDITTAAKRLLSLTSADAVEVGQAAPVRLTQLVVARFDMDVVEARVFLNFCGAVHVAVRQKADGEFYVQLRRGHRSIRAGLPVRRRSAGTISPHD